MVTQSALTELAKAAGLIGILLVNPLHGNAAEPAKVMAVQPAIPVKTIQAPAVKAPPVALPKPDLPVMTKPIAIQPITPGPIAVQPVRTVKPDVSLTPISPKSPLTPVTPIGKADQPLVPGADGSITGTLMEHQKLTTKEAREDRSIARDEKRLANAAKAQKLKLDNESIKSGMDESGEKSDRLIGGAQVEMGVGIVSGAQQIGAGAGSPGGKGGKNADIDKDSLQDRADARRDARDAHHEAAKESRVERAEARREREEALRNRAEARRDARDAHREAAKESRIERAEARREARGDAHDKDSDSRKDALEDKIGKMDAQQGRMKDQADKLNKTSNKMDQLQPQFTDGQTGDIESLVQTVLMENQRQANADLKQQLKEVKDGNSKKNALREAAKDADDARDKDGGKGGKTVAASPVAAVSTATPKNSLISRPCTPINPC